MAYFLEDWITFNYLKFILIIMVIELDNTEEKIVGATFGILQKEGSKKATTKRIAAEAGVNEVTIFRKFESKKNLIKITKEYYVARFVGKLEDIFEFSDDDEIADYLSRCFYKILDIPENDFSIIKIAMEDVRAVPDRKHLISNFTDIVIEKLEDFFKFQIEKGEVREINPKVLSLMCFSMIFQSVILWKIYDDRHDVENKDYSDDFLDLLFNGIKP